MPDRTLLRSPSLARRDGRRHRRLRRLDPAPSTVREILYLRKPDTPRQRFRLRSMPGGIGGVRGSRSSLRDETTAAFPSDSPNRPSSVLERPTIRDWWTRRWICSTQAGSSDLQVPRRSSTTSATSASSTVRPTNRRSLAAWTSLVPETASSSSSTRSSLRSVSRPSPTPRRARREFCAVLGYQVAIPNAGWLSAPP
jgi:hypothetical protein